MTRAAKPCGHPLAYVRRHVHGWSQMELARRIARREHGRAVPESSLLTIKNKVWRWENYDTVPDLTAQHILAELFGVLAAHVQRHPWPRWLPAWEAPAQHHPWSRAGTVNALDELTRSGHMDTRGFPVLKGALLTDPTHRWLVTDPQPAEPLESGKPVGEDTVRQLESQTETLRLLDDDFGGGDLRAMVEHLHRFTVRLLREASYTASVGRRMFAVAADLSRLAGWMAFEAGQNAAAQNYLLTALRAAHTAGDRLLGANVLIFLSIQTYSVGNPRDAVTILDTARSGIRDVADRSAVSAMISARLARAHAKAGNRRECEQAMERAETELARAVQEQSPPWAYYVDTAEIQAAIGSSWLELDEPGLAQTALRTAIDGRPADRYQRDRSYFLSRLAVSQVRQRELERAVETAGEAVELNTHRLRSGRSVEFLVDLLAELEPYRQEPIVAEFHGRVRELTEAR